MKMILLSAVLALGMTTATAFVSDRHITAQAVRPTAGVTAVDREVRELVKRIYPAFVLIGGGSGVCISEDGYMLTNHHVYAGAVRPGSMVVRMAGNSRQFTAEAVGADPRGDIVLAKLKLAPGEKVPFVKLAEADSVNIGDLCVCIGNPFMLAGTGTEPTVTLGTVTACNRFQGGYSDAIQIDTPINPGNSGGPAFNIDGEIIGINGRNIANHGKRYNTGAGFAIPAGQIRNFMDAFKAAEGGALIVRHGLIAGLKIDLAGRQLGAPVADVEEGSDAEEVGFRKGDLIVAMDDKTIFNGYRYYGVVGIKPRGSVFRCTVKRGEETLTLTARNNLPVEAGQFQTIPRSDDEARNTPAGPMMMDPFRLPSPKSSLACTVRPNDERKVGGYVITAFTQDGDSKDSPLIEAGLEIGDVITHINDRRIAYFCDFTDIMIALDPGTKVKVNFLRKGASHEVEVALGRYRAPRR